MTPLGSRPAGVIALPVNGPEEGPRLRTFLNSAAGSYRGNPRDLVMHDCGAMVAVGAAHVCPDVVLRHERDQPRPFGERI